MVHPVTTSIFSTQNIFLLFGMLLTLGGLAGGQKIKIISIEFGPIKSVWRRCVMIFIGLTIITAIGLLEMGAI